MVSTTHQAALPQTGANDSIFTMLQLMEGIINRASNHYVLQGLSVYCCQEPLGHEIRKHKEELKAEIPSQLEAILEKKISGEGWLAMWELSKIVKYATVDKFDLGKQKWFDMLSDDFREIYDRVLRMDDTNRTETQPPVYYRPKRHSGDEGLQSSKA